MEVRVLFEVCTAFCAIYGIIFNESTICRALSTYRAILGKLYNIIQSYFETILAVVLCFANSLANARACDQMSQCIFIFFLRLGNS